MSQKIYVGTDGLLGFIKEEFSTIERMALMAVIPVCQCATCTMIRIHLNCNPETQSKMEALIK